MTIVGLPAETKDGERRVALLPDGVGLVTQAGHEVLVQAGAGDGAGSDDAAYVAAGARIVAAAEPAWRADLVVKVKEPQPTEFRFLRPDLRLFAYLHLAAEPALLDALLERRVEAHAFETVEGPDGSLPLLAPMSEVAGHAATLAGARYLGEHGGTLITGVAGAPPARVVVIGLGIAGRSAARTARALGAEVCGIDIDQARLRQALYEGVVTSTAAPTPGAVAQEVARADLVVGAALVPGGRAPTVVDESHVAAMRPGSVVVDLAIDQGGCIATSRPTTLSDPVYTEHGVAHYCVTNVPGQYPRTSSAALSAVLAPAVVRLAGPTGRSVLVGSLNVADGVVVHPAVPRPQEVAA